MISFWNILFSRMVCLSVVCHCRESGVAPRSKAAEVACRVWLFPSRFLIPVSKEDDGIAASAASPDTGLEWGSGDPRREVCAEAGVTSVLPMDGKPFCRDGMYECTIGWGVGNLYPCLSLFGLFASSAVTVDVSPPSWRRIEGAGGSCLGVIWEGVEKPEHFGWEHRIRKGGGIARMRLGPALSRHGRTTAVPPEAPSRHLPQPLDGPRIHHDASATLVVDIPLTPSNTTTYSSAAGRGAVRSPAVHSTLLLVTTVGNGFRPAGLRLGRGLGLRRCLPAEQIAESTGMECSQIE